MNTPYDPQITSVEMFGNSILVEFKNDPEIAIFPARMLHSARVLANAMAKQREVALKEAH